MPHDDVGGEAQLFDPAQIPDKPEALTRIRTRALRQEDGV